MIFFINIVSPIIVTMSVYLFFWEWKLGAAWMEDPERIQASIAHFIARLPANTSSSAEKELVTKRVLKLAKFGRDSRAAIGSHPRAISLLVAILKFGTTTAKVIATLIPS